jgi:hypothetical protein
MRILTRALEFRPQFAVLTSIHRSCARSFADSWGPGDQS